MRAIQRAIVGVGLALAVTVALALLVGRPGSLGPDADEEAPERASGPRIPYVDVPGGPPEPVTAAEDSSVGTLPPPPGSSQTAQFVSRDLVPPPSSRDAGKPAGAQKARAAKPARTRDHDQITPEQDFGVAQNSWDWDARKTEWGDQDDRDDQYSWDEDDHRSDRDGGRDRDDRRHGDDGYDRYSDYDGYDGDGDRRE